MLEDKHKPLAARLGFIAKKIASKHLVHIKGLDPPKLRRCKACQAPITCEDVKSKRKLLVITCSLCGIKRHYSNSLNDTKTKKVDKRMKMKLNRSRRKKKVNQLKKNSARVKIDAASH